MSASREKKQRQAGGSSEPVSQAQQEQAAYQKKARTYTIIGIVIAVLVVLLLIWNTGIFQKNATAATIGDTKLSAAELSYYYYDTRYMYAMYGMIDNSASDASQKYSETQTYQDFFLESALASAKNIEALYNEALASGYSDADAKDLVSSQIANMKQSAASNGYGYKPFLKAIYGPFVTPAIFKEMVTREAVVTLYYNDISEETLNSFTAEDLEAYYAENADLVDDFTYSFLYFKPATVDTKNEDGSELSEDEITALKEEAMAAAKSAAEAALASYNSGTDIAALIEETTPSSSADHTTVTGSGSIASAYREKLLALGKDEAALVEYEGNGYYVVIFHERGRNEQLTVNVRHILCSADATTDSSGAIVAPSVKDMLKAEEDAKAILAEFEAGERTAEAFGALANKHSDDAGSNTNGGLYEGVREGNFVAEFNDWLFGEEERSVGDTAIIRHDGSTSSSNSYWGYHVTYVESFGESHWQAAVRETLTSDAMDKLQEDVSKDYAAELAPGAYHIGK